MAGKPQLTGAGMIKMQALEEASVQLQLLHGLVERMAMVQRAQQPLAPLVAQLRRAAVPLQEKLKGHFDPIADQVTHMVLSATRGGSDQRKVTALREGVGGLRSAIEIAQRKVGEQFAVDEKAKPA
jgi:hypothetical protein